MSWTKLIAVVLFAPAFMAVSLQLRLSVAFIMAAALLLLPVASYIAGRAAVRRLQYSREIPPHVVEEEPIRVSVHARGRHSVLGPIDVHDVLPRWIREETEGGTVARSPGEVVVTYTGKAEKRGEYTIGPLNLRVADVLGFFKFPSTQGLMSRLVVFPTPLVIPDLNLLPIGQGTFYQYEGSGASGSGIDFHGVREYHPGDELRRVHWRSTARHGNLNVVEYEHAKAGDVVIALDLLRGTEKGTGRFTTLEYAVKIAAGVAQQMQAMGSNVGMAWSGLQGPAAETGRGPSHEYAIMEALATVSADQGDPLSAALLKRSGFIPAGATVICLGTSIGDDLRRCAEILSDRGITIQFIMITLPGGAPASIAHSASMLAEAGVSLTVVECSEKEVRGHVSYEYAA